MASMTRLLSSVLISPWSSRVALAIAAVALPDTPNLIEAIAIFLILVVFLVLDLLVFFKFSGTH